MTAEAMQDQIKRVAECGPLRAWSVIVSVLGDLCRAPNDKLSARVLNELIGRLGITSQTSRVAIHRLKSDGWIETQRDGRASLYKLSATGMAQAEAVRERIYSATAPKISPTLLVGAPDMSQADFVDIVGEEAVFIAARTALAPAPERNPDLMIVPFDPSSDAFKQPKWLASALAPQQLVDDLSDLASVVREIAAPPVSTSLFARTALRLAILHHWRRLCLRTNPLADALLPDDWAGAQTRAVVVAALERLDRPSPDELSENLLQETAPKT